MGRSNKTVLSDEGIDRRTSGYYSTPEFVADFVFSELVRHHPNGIDVFDPCVGKNELVRNFINSNKRVTAFDVWNSGEHTGVAYEQRDFLEFYRDWRIQKRPPIEADYLVANPPYNCHEVDYIRRNKVWLSEVFPEAGIGNMYSMFMSALVDIAKPGAVIGLIVLDSFLTAGSHAGLRRKILNSCNVLNLHLCPADLFRNQNADVRTCVLILRKSDEKTQTSFSNRPKNSDAFQKILSDRAFDLGDHSQLALDGEEDHAEIIIGCPEDIRDLFKHPRIGQRFPCVTGISTGNDKEFLSSVRNDRFTIPFYKNPATRRFRTTPDAYLPGNFLTLPKQFPNFMIRNKSYLFREGICCSSMGVAFGCAYLPQDSAFGVNANIFPPKEDIYWMIAYLNSSLVTYLVRSVLLRGNMITSGYVSRIPLIPLPTKTLKYIGDLARYACEQSLSQISVQEIIQLIDQRIFYESALSVRSENEIRNFAGDVLKAT